MTGLAWLYNHPMRLWAWGINGRFSVIGAAAVPIVATGFGLSARLLTAGLACLVAAPAVFFRCCCHCAWRWPAFQPPPEGGAATALRVWLRAHTNTAAAWRGNSSTSARP